MRRLLRLLIGLVILLALLFGGLLFFSTITDYRPEPGSEESVTTEGLAADSLLPDTLSMLIWNIGYAGLGAEMDFFNDGGKGVRPDEVTAARYLKAIRMFLESMQDSVDLMLLQEVDRNSKRSYYTDQVNVLGENLKDFDRHFALNYDVKFVPVPFSVPYTPYGKTFGGLLSLARFKSLKNTRIQYPGGFGWPTRLYMLDRCALEQRYPLKNGKQLVVVNTHNTAYDETGAIKAEEMAFIKKRYEAEVAKGNTVILGGDWNQVPPGFDARAFVQNIPAGYTPQALSNEQLPAGFKVCFDARFPSNRSNDTSYLPGRNYTTLIDYFVVSSNVEVLETRTIDMQFRYSDHQPVLLKVVLKD